MRRWDEKGRWVSWEERMTDRKEGRKKGRKGERENRSKRRWEMEETKRKGGMIILC